MVSNLLYLVGKSIIKSKCIVIIKINYRFLNGTSIDYDRYLV